MHRIDSVGKFDIRIFELSAKPKPQIKISDIFRWGYRTDDVQMNTYKYNFDFIDDITLNNDNSAVKGLFKHISDAVRFCYFLILRKCRNKAILVITAYKQMFHRRTFAVEINMSRNALYRVFHSVKAGESISELFAISSDMSLSLNIGFQNCLNSHISRVIINRRLRRRCIMIGV